MCQLALRSGFTTRSRVEPVRSARPGRPQRKKKCIKKIDKKLKKYSFESMMRPIQSGASDNRRIASFGRHISCYFERTGWDVKRVFTASNCGVSPFAPAAMRRGGDRPGDGDNGRRVFNLLNDNSTVANASHDVAYGHIFAGVRGNIVSNVSCRTGCSGMLTVQELHDTRKRFQTVA